nr:hypothetical protein [Volvox reticuliferus]
MIAINTAQVLSSAGATLACSFGATSASTSSCIAAALPSRRISEEAQIAGSSLGTKGYGNAAKGHKLQLLDATCLTTSAAGFASLSRVLLVGQPSSMFRTLANRKWPSSVGPISLLVFLFGTILALIAAVRGALVRKVKACKCCKGFGVVRCRLCNGRGTVDWRAKFSYSETCPLCTARRFVICPDCGGHYHRRLFNHAKGFKGTLETYFPMAAPNSVVQARSNPLD